MIEQSVIDAYNARQTVDLNNIKKMKPEELDRVVKTGSAAEALMTNKDFAMFVHQYKFEICDVLSAIEGHTDEDNNLRVGLTNQLTGIDGFIKSLKRSVYFKQRVVTIQKERLTESEEPNT